MFSESIIETLAFIVLFPLIPEKRNCNKFKLKKTIKVAENIPELTQMQKFLVLLPNFFIKLIIVLDKF